MILMLWPSFKKTLSSDMPSKIYVASFGNFCLCVTNQQVRARVLGKRVNLGAAGQSLEIAVCFVFQDHVKGVEWIKKKIDEAEKKVQVRFENA